VVDADNIVDHPSLPVALTTSSTPIIGQTLTTSSTIGHRQRRPPQWGTLTTSSTTV